MSSKRAKFENFLNSATPCFWLATVLALALRFFLMPYQSGDMGVFLKPWLQFIRSNDGIFALGQEFSNYSPSYLYLLAIASYLPQSLPEVFTIKLWSIFFDFVAAFFVSRLVMLRYNSHPLSALAYFLTLFTPTVVLNSSMWGQCDSIYAALLLGCLYFLATKRPILACIIYGLAISFKLQAVFFAPLLAIFLINKEIRLVHLLLVPVMFLVMLIPAFLLGRPLQELLMVYVEQANYYRNLALNSATIYLWFSDGSVFKQVPDTHYDLIVPAGYVLCASFAAMWVALAYYSKQRLVPQVSVTLAYLFLLGMPFLLPKMHDRYMYAADIAALVFVFFHPRMFYVAVLQQVVSLSVYLNVLMWKGILEQQHAAIVAGFLLLLAMRQAFRELYGDSLIADSQDQVRIINLNLVLRNLALLLLLFAAFVFFGNWRYGSTLNLSSIAIPLNTGSAQRTIEPFHASQEWKVPTKGLSLDGEALYLAGTQLNDVISVHANSRLAFKIPKTAKSFSASAALPSYLPHGSKTSLRFEVRLDGKNVWQSGLMKVGSSPKEIVINLGGATNLELVVVDADDGNLQDHALWIAPHFR